jgi:hypothetical protein
MKRAKLCAIAIFTLVGTSALWAVPLTWNFEGITSPGSTYHGSAIDGLAFQYRVFLDTDDPLLFHSANDFLYGGHPGEIAIQSVATFSLSASQVGYFAPAGGDVEQLRVDLLGAVNFIEFLSNPIATSPLALSSIPATTPSGPGTELLAGGPPPFFDFSLRLNVSSFSATLSPASVPDGGSAWTNLVVAAAALAAARLAVRNAQQSSTPCGTISSPPSADRRA